MVNRKRTNFSRRACRHCGCKKAKRRHTPRWATCVTSDDVTKSDLQYSVLAISLPHVALSLNPPLAPAMIWGVFSLQRGNAAKSRSCCHQISMCKMSPTQNNNAFRDQKTCLFNSLLMIAVRKYKMPAGPSSVPAPLGAHFELTVCCKPIRL